MCQRYFETPLCRNCIRPGTTRLIKRTCWPERHDSKPDGWTCREAPVRITQLPNGRTSRPSHRGTKEKFYWMDPNECSQCYRGTVNWMLQSPGNVLWCGRRPEPPERMLEVTRRAIAEVRERFRVRAAGGRTESVQRGESGAGGNGGNDGRRRTERVGEREGADERERERAAYEREREGDMEEEEDEEMTMWQARQLRNLRRWQVDLDR